MTALLELEGRKIRRAQVINDSVYCTQALKEDVSIWEENGFESAKARILAHQDLWKKIAELRLNMDLEGVHQRSHTRQELTGRAMKKWIVLSR